MWDCPDRAVVHVCVGGRVRMSVMAVTQYTGQNHSSGECAPYHF